MRRTDALNLCMLTVMIAIAGGCATTQGDPLRNTKKLVAEGHASLYNNGAFQVPRTSIRLIPAGPSTTEFVRELMGMRARQSFELSIQRAAESVTIVSEGTKFTYRLAKDVHEGGDAGADYIRRNARENSTLLVYRSTDLGRRVIGKSWDVSKQLWIAKEHTGDEIISGARASGNELMQGGAAQGAALAAALLDSARTISASGAHDAGKAFSFAGRSFVKGYAAIPSRLKKRGGAIGDRLSDMNPIDIMKEENDTRETWSAKTVDLMTDTVSRYTENVSDSFDKAGNELSGNYQTTGLSLSVLKSLRWVLKGILWDATIKPAANITAASLGYIGVNFVAYPAMVVVREGVAATKLALEVTWDTAKTGFDIAAPSTVAALAGVYGVLDFTGSQVVAGAAAAGGGVLGYGEAGLSQVAGVAVKAGGYAAGKGVQYIGIPLASAGIALGGGTVGTVVGAAGATAGGAMFVTGEAGSATTQVFGNVIAGAALAGGTVASAAAGAAYGVYELSKAVVVPAGYELGGGIVLSYETMAQLSAQTILAVSDCAYMVLSLEGPRWVLYAVKGKTDTGEDLPTSAVVDLKKMQMEGEEIYNLPVRDEEMSRIVHSAYENLPEQKAAENGNGETTP